MSEQLAQGLVITTEKPLDVFVNHQAKGEVTATGALKVALQPGDYSVLMHHHGTTDVAWRQTVTVPAGKPITIDTARGVPASDGTLKTVKIGALEWTAEDSTEMYYRSSPGAGIPTAVRYYDYAGAAVTAPAGWRVPSEEDYRSLISLFANPADALINGSFGAKRHGTWKKGPRDVGSLGLYWTSTRTDPVYHVVALLSGSSVLFERRNAGDSSDVMFTVRYVRDLH